MPPMSTYTFKHKISSAITITLEVYGDKDAALKRLSNFVINVNEWFVTTSIGN